MGSETTRGGGDGTYEKKPRDTFSIREPKKSLGGFKLAYMCFLIAVEPFQSDHRNDKETEE
jgi:hypothetical protein